MPSLAPSLGLSDEIALVAALLVAVSGLASLHLNTILFLLRCS